MAKKIIINIGREFGSGGLAVARELGKKLNIPVYDKELILKAAQDSGFSADFFTKNDEKRHFFSLSSIFSTGTDDYISESGLFMIQSETIKRIAEKDSAVIVGRCSDYILRELDCTVDVFITSKPEIRAQRVSERNGISFDEAMSLIEKKDKVREEYYNYYTYCNWGKASNYDLCIDSSILGIEGTADYIIDFAKKSGLI